jgi:hypothetical protein
MTLTDRCIKPGLRLFQCIASVRGARAREAPNAAHDALRVQMTQQEREALEAEEQRVEQPARSCRWRLCVLACAPPTVSVVGAIGHRARAGAGDRGAAAEARGGP